MASDGEVIQRQHFCHHGDTICHPKSGYVTTKLHGTSTCGCNNNAIFSGRAIFTFPACGIVVCTFRIPGTECVLCKSPVNGVVEWNCVMLFLHQTTLHCRLPMPATLIWPRHSMAALLNSLVFVFNISFLPKYRVKYYDYIVK